VVGPPEVFLDLSITKPYTVIMQITNKTTETITTETYEITTDYHGDVIYIEYLNEKGKVIDCVLRDSDGNDLSNLSDAPALLEEIQELVDLSN
jgi:hypothetical protein